MIVDTSAIVAVLLGELESNLFQRLLAEGPVAISAATLTECRIVLEGKPARGLVGDFEQLLGAAEVEVVAVDGALARAAADAHVRYGRGSGSPAKLNFGDCFSYALAIARDEPLLFKGDDFIHTDVRIAG